MTKQGEWPSYRKKTDPSLVELREELGLPPLDAYAGEIKCLGTSCGKMFYSTNRRTNRLCPDCVRDPKEPPRMPVAVAKGREERVQFTIHPDQFREKPMRRSDSSIREQIRLADEVHEQGSKWPGLSYEEGVANALRWALGEDAHAPMDE